MDYSHLKGKELIMRFNNSNIKCFVADIDENVGITIKQLSNQIDTFCLNSRSMGSLNNYFDKFIFMINAIEGGLYVSEEYVKEFPDQRPNIFSIYQKTTPCAFK